MKTMVFLFLTLAFSPLATAQPKTLLEAGEQGYRWAEHAGDGRTFVWVKELPTTQAYPVNSKTIFEKDGCVVKSNEQYLISDVSIIHSVVPPLLHPAKWKVEYSEIAPASSRTTVGVNPEEPGQISPWLFVPNQRNYVKGKTDKTVYKVFFADKLRAREELTVKHDKESEYVSQLIERYCRVESPRAAALQPAAVTSPEISDSPEALR